MLRLEADAYYSGSTCTLKAFWVKMDRLFNGTLLCVLLSQVFHQWGMYLGDIAYHVSKMQTRQGIVSLEAHVKYCYYKGSNVPCNFGAW